jgi:hypothetical protein
MFLSDRDIAYSLQQKFSVKYLFRNNRCHILSRQAELNYRSRVHDKVTGLVTYQELPNYRHTV